MASAEHMAPGAAGLPRPLGGPAPEGTSLWPSLQPEALMQDALLAKATFSGCRNKGDLTPPGMMCEFGQPNSTERIERALGHAFDRLWCCDRNERDLAVPSVEGAANDELIHSIDCYIAQHFRRVAELSRESIYQGHQYQLWNRMKENVRKCGQGQEDDGVADHLRELDDKINRAALDDYNVQQEINNLMRIVQGSPAAAAAEACAARAFAAASTSSSGAPGPGGTVASSCCSHCLLTGVAPLGVGELAPPLFGAYMERRRCCSACAPCAACCSTASGSAADSSSLCLSSSAAGGAPMAIGGATPPLPLLGAGTSAEGSGACDRSRQVPKCALCSTEGCALQ